MKLTKEEFEVISWRIKIDGKQIYFYPAKADGVGDAGDDEN